MKRKWFLPIATLAVSAALILTSFGIVSAQTGEVVVKGKVSTTAKAGLKVGLDPNEQPPTINECTGGTTFSPLHVVREDPDGRKLDDCEPRGGELAVSPREGRTLTITSRSMPRADKISELHVDLNIVNPSTTARIELGMPVVNHSPGIIVSIGDFLSHCWPFILQPPWIIPPGGSLYCGINVILPPLPPSPPKTFTFNVQFPVRPQ